jgi:hypothetical protein
MLCTDAGGYRGHCGEIDSRGRVFSGHPRDEALREAAAAIAARAAEHGLFGPCGIDAFTWLEPGPGDEAGDATERLRPVVELNARPTMGLVTLGLVRRALPQVREALELTPGERRGFLFTLVEDDLRAQAEDIVADAGPGASVLCLTKDPEPDAPTPLLFFGREMAALREAHRRRAEG